MVTWETTDEVTAKPSLVKRAKRRRGLKLGPEQWLVFGDPKLSDSYEEYGIRKVNGRYRCDCQEHAGGEYRRKLCSHILYVTLAESGQAEWADTSQAPEGFEWVEDEQAKQALFAEATTEIPFFVDPTYEQLVDPEHTAQRRKAIDLMFGTEPPLPDWVTWIRGAQWKAVTEAADHFADGKRIIIIEAPTGTGKSLMGELIRRYTNIKQMIYTCMTKSLQDQFERDYPYANVIKGRANYPIADDPSNKFLNAGLCTMEYLNGDIVERPCCPFPTSTRHCAYCHPVSSCYYEKAKIAAQNGSLALANMAFLLNTWRSPDSKFKGKPLLVIDEADELESQLMNFVEVKLTAKLREELGIGMPERKTVGKYRDGPKEWQEWIISEALPAVQIGIQKLGHPDTQTPKERSKHIRLTRLAEALRSVASEVLSEDEGGWVYDGYTDGDVIFKPVKVSQFGKELVFNNATRTILMSATVISAGQMAKDLGLERNDYAFIETGSGFPIERRPIYVERVANVTKRGIEDGEVKYLIDRIAEICEERTDEGILIHTVSYKLNSMLVKGLEAKGIPKHKLFTYYDASYRETALRKFRASKGGILLAPSFERGIDLKGDDCRVVIIAKVPFPYLGDKQVQARMNLRDGSGWYSTTTIRSIVQMTGRAMRSKDDWCETFILDKQFNDNVMARSKRILPQWWAEAMVPYKRGRKALLNAIGAEDEIVDTVRSTTKQVSW